MFAVPIPKEHSIDSDIIENVIDKSLNNIPSDIEGKNVTPYLLAQVAKITGGKSLQSSILYFIYTFLLINSYLIYNLFLFVQKILWVVISGT